MTTLNPHGKAALVLTCEHASAVVPAEYANLGLRPTQLEEHIGWDIGAADVTAALSRALDAPAVLASVSRLVIDCNRDRGDHDLIVQESDGVKVPGNAHVDAAERARRLGSFYEPFHRRVDAVLAQRPGAALLSVHSFTPTLNGRERPFDIGVLFDSRADDAQRIGAALAREGLQVRYNEPYSGFDGLIFSARRHGRTHGRRYLEIEANNRLLRESAGAAAIAAAVARALAQWVR